MFLCKFLLKTPVSSVSVMLHRVHWVAPGAWSSALKNVTCASNRIVCMKDFAVVSNGISSKYITLFSPHIILRYKSNNVNENSSLSEVKESSSSQLTLGEKVKQTTKDASYLGIIIAGIGVTGVMFYAILSELFSGQSPNSIYTETLKLCRNDEKLADLLGGPIKGYGELSARGRRRHVSHIEYEKDGRKYMRMKFYVEGSRQKGTVHLEMKQDPKGKYSYRYLFVDIDKYPPQTYVIKDNRHEDSSDNLHFTE